MVYISFNFEVIWSTLIVDQWCTFGCKKWPCGDKMCCVVLPVKVESTCKKFALLPSKTLFRLVHLSIPFVVTTLCWMAHAFSSVSFLLKNDQKMLQVLHCWYNWVHLFTIGLRILWSKIILDLKSFEALWYLTYDVNLVAKNGHVETKNVAFFLSGLGPPYPKRIG